MFYCRYFKSHNYKSSPADHSLQVACVARHKAQSARLQTHATCREADHFGWRLERMCGEPSGIGVGVW